jgi:hypothetical protein
MKRNTVTILFLISAMFIFADEKGDEIARKYFELKKPKDTYAMMTMIIIEKSGKKVRKLEMFSKDQGEGINSFARFLEPADVKDVKFLTISHKKAENEQRLYLPAMNKSRKISSDNKDGKFVGSDLYYYDMEDRKFEEFTYKYLRDETYNNMECSVIEMTPKDKNAPYSKTLVWINKNNNFIYKSDCYDKSKNDLLKRIVVVEVKEIKGYLIPVKMVVDSIKDGTKTLMQEDNLQIDNGLKDDIFTVQNLEK